MTWYTLICYRPNGADYCRGCLMDSSSSDFEMIESENPEDIAKKLVEKRREDRDSGRHVAHWENTLLVNGQSEHYLDSPAENLHNRVYLLTETFWEKFLADEKEAKIKAEEAAKIAEAERKAQNAIEKEKRELEEFKRLQKKYGAKA